MTHIESEMPRRVTSSPLYAQLATIFKELIVTEDWQVGSALPSEADLARRYGVSTGTTRKALDMLEDSGWVKRQQGRGTFVTDATARQLDRFCPLFAPGGTESIVKTFAQTWAGLELAQATAEECSRFNVSAPSKVVRMKRIFDKRGAVGMIEQQILRADLFQGIEKRTNLPANLYSVFAHDYAILVTRCTDKLRAVKASPEQAQALGVAPDFPLLEARRTMEDAEGRIVAISTRHIVGDRVEYMVSLT